MKRGALALMICMTAALAPASQTRGPVPAASVWEGSVFLHRFRAGCCLEADGDLRGVLRVRTPRGAENIYHYLGALRPEDAVFQASHHSGHKAQGRLLGPDAAELTITSREGRTVIVRARRVPQTLPDDECGPGPW